MYKAVSSNFRVAFVDSFPKKKCGDGNRCSMGVPGMEISRGPVAQGPYKFGWATRN
jgi:hypothetical protein